MTFFTEVLNKKMSEENFAHFLDFVLNFFIVPEALPQLFFHRRAFFPDFLSFPSL